VFDFENNGSVTKKLFKRFLERRGFFKDHSELTELFAGLKHCSDRINYDEFHSLVKKQIKFLLKVFSGNIVIEDFPSFSDKVTEVFEFIRKTVSHTEGKNADYIPALADINPELFAISICTVDGQKFNLGD